MNEALDSTLLDNAVSELSKLPGIGRKTALRLALHLLRREEKEARALAESIINLREKIRYCRVCHNISEEEVCPICSDNRRDKSIICVVENIKDVMAVESTRQYHGSYHILGGVIAPLDGVSPADLEIDSLVERVDRESIKEIILALSPTIEGDTTNYYIYRKLAGKNVKITILARGLSIGNDLEYTDELSLGKSFQNRLLYESTFNKE